MKIQILTSIILLVIGFSSCCRPKEIGRYELNSVDKQIIPYEKGQTISFSDSTGQAFDMKVTKNEMAWTKDIIDCATCCEHYTMLNLRTVDLHSENIDISLIMNSSIDYFLDKGNSYGYSTIVVRSPFDYFFGLQYDINGQLIAASDTYDLQFYDNLEINGKIYYDVFKHTVYKDYKNNYIYYDKNEYEIITDKKIPLELLYNKTYGILQIIRDDKVFISINE